MKTILTYCLLLLAVALPLRALYWHAFRPVLITRFRYRIYQCRDALRLLLIEGVIQEGDEAFRIIERHCNRTISLVSEISLPDLITTSPDTDSKESAEKQLEAISSSPSAVRKCYYDAILTTFGAALANTPGVFPLLLFLGLLFTFFLWFGRWKTRFKSLFLGAISSFDRLPVESARC